VLRTSTPSELHGGLPCAGWAQDPRPPRRRPRRSARATKVGAPDDDAYHGPLNNPVQLARVAGLVDRRDAGAEIVAGGQPLHRPGYFYPPTVIAGVRPDDELAGAEIFGPVVTVSRFDDKDEAVAWANGTDYALGSSVWTTDHARAERVARRLDAARSGSTATRSWPPRCPTEGTRGSGFGTDLSAYSMEEYTRMKHVMARFDR